MIDIARGQFTPELYTGPKHFAHLHNHTVYSSLDGVGSPEEYAKRCVDFGHPAMAITEHGNMSSVPDCYFAYSSNGIKYIPGNEIYFNDYEPLRQQMVQDGTKMADLKAQHPEIHQRFARNRHLTVLAKNEVGFKNLLKLSTQAYETGFYYKPRIWFDKLCEFREGLIVLSGCLNGPVSHELRLEGGPRFESKDKRGAIDWIKKFKAVFKEDYYMEVQMPGIENDWEVFWRLVELADQYKIKLVLANDCHYLHKSDYWTQKLMMAIDQGVTINSPDLFCMNSDSQYMKTRGELWATFKNGKYSEKVDDRLFEEMCDNTLRVVDTCKTFKPDIEPKQPNIKNAADKLRIQVAKALKKRGLDTYLGKHRMDGREVTYMEQAKLELDRFIDKGFASYFYITQDIINYGRSQGWPFSPRGSAGGSLVNFLLGISTIDPMLWGLSADRFLADSRGGYMLKVTMPEEKTNAK